MDRTGSDAVFSGSIAELYDTHLVPLIFEPYAAELASRVAALQPSRVLETAAGTGVVTRALARILPSTVALVATDLNQPMLDRAEAVGTQRPVRWQQADAAQLPFDDASFDVVVCQFGVMFFPDKVRAYSEARRVLRHVECSSSTPGIASRTTSSPTRSRRRSLVSFLRTLPVSWRVSPTATSTGRRFSPTCQTPDSARRRFSRRPQRAVVQCRHTCRPSPIAREHPCATRSRRAPVRVWPKRHRHAPLPSPNDSAKGRSTEKSRRTWLSPGADRPGRGWPSQLADQGSVSGQGVR